MHHHRLVRLLDSSDHDEDVGRRLCIACVTLLSVSGAAVGFISDRTHRGPLWSSDETAGRLEESQYTLGEGPTIDADASGKAVLEPSLEDAAAATRWPAFTPSALGFGARAVFAFPIRIGLVRFGALALYRTTPGQLSYNQSVEGRLMADVLARAILSAQADVPSGMIAAELEELAVFHPEVHQATGILSARLGVSVTDAMVRLRARSYALDRRIGDVAADIVAGRSGFE